MSLLLLSLISPLIVAQNLDLCNIHGKSSIYEETIDYNSRKRIISSNSCPNHFSQCQESVCGGEVATKALRTDFYYEVPLYPVISREKTDTTCVNGTIGIALNGVGIESMSHDSPQCVSPSIGGQSVGDKSCNLNGIDDGTKVCGDAVQSDYRKFDKCGGHANDFGVYHYHIPPACLLHQLESLLPSLPQNHSPQIGWSLDGFPIYGPIGPLGVPILPCTHPSADAILCLDECNGLYAHLFDIDQYMYRYYVTGPIASDSCRGGEDCEKVEGACCADAIPSIEHRPYTIGCYRGCRIPLPDVDGQKKCLVSDQSGVSDDFYPSLSSFPRGIYSPSSPEVPPPSPSPNQPSTPSSPPSEIISPPKKSYLGFGSTVVRYDPTHRHIGRLEMNLTAEKVNVEIYETGGREAFITGITSQKSGGLTAEWVTRSSFSSDHLL
jgi:hypothetical protein